MLVSVRTVVLGDQQVVTSCGPFSKRIIKRSRSGNCCLHGGLGEILKKQNKKPHLERTLTLPPTYANVGNSYHSSFYFIFCLFFAQTLMEATVTSPRLMILLGKGPRTRPLLVGVGSNFFLPFFAQTSVEATVISPRLMILLGKGQR